MVFFNKSEFIKEIFMNEIGIEIRDSLNVDEYNNLRKQVGWESKNPIVV